MHPPPFLLQAMVYLGAAALFVPLFHRIGLGSVLGYLMAGIVIGPGVAALIGDPSSVAGVSELGVVLLLFLVGLDLSPARLWSMRRSIFGLGLLQMTLTIALFAAALHLLGLGWQAALALGMAAAMSSTAIALQILEERKLMPSAAGQSAFAVSLFQDISVVPLLLLLSVLAAPGETTAGQTHAPGFSMTAVATAVGLLAVMIAAGRLVLRPVLRWIASTRMREVFIAFALLLVVGSAWLTQAVGLSMAMGAFIAGVLLADSEYRMELVVDIEPFKGLLLGLFFMSVGMSLDLALVRQMPLQVLGLAGAAVIAKLLVMYLLGRLFRLDRGDSLTFSLSLSAIGEFAFVLLGVAAASRLIDGTQAGLANAVVAASMLTTPVLFTLLDRFRARHTTALAPRTADTIDEHNRVIVAGMGRFGQVVVRMLTAKNIALTVIDHDPDQVELARQFGWRTYYGDVRRPDVLESAGIAEASLCILAIDDTEGTLAITRELRTQYPNLAIIARARGRTDALELERLGASSIRETFGSALAAAELALRANGISAPAARRASLRFQEHDRSLFARQLEAGGDRNKLIAIAAQGRRDLRALLQSEQAAADDPGLEVDKPA